MDQKRPLLTIGEYIEANCRPDGKDHFVVSPFSNIGNLQHAIQTFDSEGGARPAVLDSLNQAPFSLGTTEVARELPTNQ